MRHAACGMRHASVIARSAEKWPAPALVHNRRVTVRPDRRLALLAMAKLAGVSALVGVAVGVGMTLDGEPKWFLLAAPAGLAGFGAVTLGVLVALMWWAFPGRVTYTVADGFLTARRGNWTRKRIPIDRVAEIEFDQQIEWSDLVFSGWFGWISPIPMLLVTMTATTDRWDPSNGAVEPLPRILVSGAGQVEALRQLREAGLAPGSWTRGVFDYAASGRVAVSWFS